MDELTLVMSVVQKLCSWDPVKHIRSNLEITERVLGTPDVVVIFWKQKETLLMSQAVGRSIINYAAPVWSPNIHDTNYR